VKKGFAAGGVIALLIAGVAGCSQPESRSEASASVTIDGKDQGKTRDVRCNQLQSSWFVEIRQVASSASAIVDVEGDKATVQTVEIRGFGGFTGSYWPGGEPANATFMNRTFTISGTASGVQTGSPIPGPVTFKIVARC
jgi:ipoprotein LpqH